VSVTISHVPAWEANDRVTGIARVGSSIFMGGTFSYVGPHTGGGVFTTPDDDDGSGGYYVGGDFKKSAANRSSTWRTCLRTARSIRPGTRTRTNRSSSWSAAGRRSTWPARSPVSRASLEAVSPRSTHRQRRSADGTHSDMTPPGRPRRHRLEVVLRRHRHDRRYAQVRGVQLRHEYRSASRHARRRPGRLAGRPGNDAVHGREVHHAWRSHGAPRNGLRRGYGRADLVDHSIPR
jgi:hypothetical protein